MGLAASKKASEGCVANMGSYQNTATSGDLVESTETCADLVANMGTFYWCSLENKAMLPANRETFSGQHCWANTARQMEIYELETSHFLLEKMEMVLVEKAKVLNATWMALCVKAMAPCVWAMAQVGREKALGVFLCVKASVRVVTGMGQGGEKDQDVTEKDRDELEMAQSGRVTDRDETVRDPWEIYEQLERAGKMIVPGQVMCGSF